MGEPVKKATEGFTDAALNVLNDTVDELEEDIRYFSDFQDALDYFQPSGSNGQVGVVSEQSRSDTDRVLKLYNKHILSNQEISNDVRDYSDRFGISLEAADFMDELLIIKNFSKDDIKETIGFLDGSNNMGFFQVQKFRNIADKPKKARRKRIGQNEAEIDDLEDYHREIRELEGRLLGLNREYELPVDLDDAVYVVDELEHLNSELAHLRDQREQDLNNRDEERGQYFDENLELFYEDEDFDVPVLEDLDALESAVDKAYENLAVNF